jgi:hypothetical protein
MRCKLESESLRLANVIYGRLLSKCRVKDLMKIVRDNPSANVYIIASRSDPLRVEIKIDKNGHYRYENGERLVIPVPKRFAVLEPDENYFRQTLKANIFLAVNGAEEKELHL